MQPVLNSPRVDRISNNSSLLAESAFSPASGRGGTTLYASPHAKYNDP
jgi:hypothetical protein